MNILRISSVVCFMILMCSSPWLPVPVTMAAPQSGIEMDAPLDQINLAAHNVTNGDEPPIRFLLDATLAAHGLDRRISASAASIKDRLVTAEMSYQNGNTGIDEERVVAVVNQLADRFKAPPYAYTNIAEVRKVRVRMLTLYPELIGRGPAVTRDDSRPHFEEKMGPIEAFHLTATLLYQKVFNPEYQLSTVEIQQGQNMQRPFENPIARDRRQQMLRIIHDKAAAMSLRDILDQSEESLDLLGIGR